ncbi:MAG: UDP-N-acetylmuramate dehydrogenase [Betaproteobacteria bacterium]
MDMTEILRIARHGLRGEFRRDEPMSRHTSWRAGGKADRAYLPADLDDLCVFLATIPADEPVHMVGLGSNLLVRDGGVRGTVVFTHGSLKRIDVTESGSIRAEAGVASPKVSRFAATHDFEGAEFLAGIPGTVGGALAMNAGCYGSETWDRVASVLVVNRRGERIERVPGEYVLGYRRCERVVAADTTRHEEWFAAAEFRFAEGDGFASRAKIKQFLSRRIAAQPLNLPNAGSVFRNPQGDYAARLIESCELKGYRIGGAMVSPKHANFIVNVGSASGSDIERLIHEVRAMVLRERGVALEPEVRVIGEPG